jgi:hypothetical protein
LSGEPDRCPWCELDRLRAENAELRDKALRYDLDRAGIEHRNAEAVELVELRAERQREREERRRIVECGDARTRDLEAENAALRADAERYLWMRDIAPLQTLYRLCDGRSIDWDETIDAARKT